MLRLRERDLTLGLASAVQRGLGRRRPGDSVLLTRAEPEENPSLAERADVARRNDASVLLSLHVNSGDRRGPEAWVHPQSDARSRQLGKKVLEQLATVTEGAPADVQRGELAVLTPSRLGRQTAACLVEVGYLSDPSFEQWIAKPANVDRMGAAIADAVAGYLSAYGARALDDDDAGYDVDGPIPADAVDDMVEAQGVSRAMAAGTDYPEASRFLAARAGHYRVPSAPRRIERVVIHITDGPTMESTTSWFRSSKNTAKTSAHYVVGQDGDIVQMVRDANVAHHAGAANGNSIGIEHVAISPAAARKQKRATLYPSDAEYCASAALVAWLCDTYNIPVDRAHILGHSEAAKTTHADCPNSVWDWDHFMNLVTSRTCAPRPTTSSSQSYGGRANGFSSPHGAAERYGRGRASARASELVEPDLTGAATWQEVLRRFVAMKGRQTLWTAGVPDTSFFPFSAVCQLQVSGAGGAGVGTGFYIGREKILTVGHNFHHAPWSDAWWASSVLVQPGFDGGSCQFPEKSFSIDGRTLVHKRWGDSKDITWDLAVLRVPGLPAPNDQWFQLPDSCPVPQDFFVAGFGQIGAGTADQPMRCDGGPVTRIDDELMYYNVNTKGGNSGSPVFVNDQSGMVVAVHRAPATATTNMGVYLTPEKLEWINAR